MINGLWCASNRSRSPCFQTPIVSSIGKKTKGSGLNLVEILVHQFLCGMKAVKLEVLFAGHLCAGDSGVWLLRTKKVFAPGVPVVCRSFIHFFFRGKISVSSKSYILFRPVA